MMIVEISKLCSDQAAMAAAYKASQWLLDDGLMRFPAPCWDQPAILAKNEKRCIALINYSFNADTLVGSVDFAFCDPDHPTALAALLLRLRSKARADGWTEIGFTCHPQNAPMRKAVAALGARILSSHYRMDVKPARVKPVVANNS